MYFVGKLFTNSNTINACALNCNCVGSNLISLNVDDCELCGIPSKEFLTSLIAFRTKYKFYN